jgi:hypothetical protein
MELNAALARPAAVTIDDRLTLASASLYRGALRTLGFECVSAIA